MLLVEREKNNGMGDQEVLPSENRPSWGTFGMGSTFVKLVPKIQTLQFYFFRGAKT